MYCQSGNQPGARIAVMPDSTYGPHNIFVMNLWPTSYECPICKGDVGSSNWFIMACEEKVFPPEYSGPCAGFPVCGKCFYAVCKFQNEHPGKVAAYAIIRAIRGM